MPRSKWALYDALSHASISVLMTMDGNDSKAEEAHTDASRAGRMAFPEGSPEAEALTVVLAAVAERARLVSA